MVNEISMFLSSIVLVIAAAIGLLTTERQGPSVRPYVLILLLTVVFILGLEIASLQNWTQYGIHLVECQK